MTKSLLGAGLLGLGLTLAATPGLANPYGAPVGYDPPEYGPTYLKRELVGVNVVFVQCYQRRVLDSHGVPFYREVCDQSDYGSRGNRR